MEEGEEEEKENIEKKKREIAMGEEGFPGIGPILLVVPCVAAVRCN
jgi:hypothetical protein